ncbi:MAG: hypothetical protein ACI9W4_000624 [Rhodothermales bacterium]|jgi:hypothetical protein
MRINSVLWLFLLIVAAPATARQFTLLNYEQAPIGTSDETAVERLQAGIAIPIRLGEVELTHGIRFKQLTLDQGTSWPATLPSGDRYQEIRYEGSVSFPMGNRWRTTVFATAGLASDFLEDVTADDVDFQAAVLMNRVSETRTIGFGLAYRNRLDVGLLPLVIYQARVGASWNVDVLAPARAAAWYQASERVTLGLAVKYNQLSYHLSDHPMQRVDHTLSTVGPSVRIGLGALPLFLELSGGIVLVNSLEYGTGNSEVTEDAGSGSFFSVSLLARQ